MRRSREEIAELLRFGHPIPVGKGYNRRYVADRYPGWTWNELMAVWRAAGILVPVGSMLTCDDRAEFVRFTGPKAWEVHWSDGSATGAPRRTEAEVES